VATAPPDGYALLLGGAGPNVVSPLSTAAKTYDPVKDFVPIALLAKGPFGIVVHPAVPATSLTEFIAHAKAVAFEDLHKAFTAGDSDPESAAKFLASELARWAPLIEAAGLKR
jgi:tripartite-type tricarboxylate transporter receptor subunit TctC